MKHEKGIPIAGIALVLILVVFMLGAGCLNSPQGPAAAQAPNDTDVYGPQLEALNYEIYSAATQAALEAAVKKVAEIEANMSGNGAYAKYVQLAEAQKASAAAINKSIIYLSEADSYGGVDRAKDYSGFISALKSGASSKSIAKMKVGGYLQSEPNSSVKLLDSRLDLIDAAGMEVFAEMLERDYAAGCPAVNAPATAYAAPLSRSDALDLVVKEVVRGGGAYVYALDAPLPAGAIVTFLRDEGDFNLTTAGETWFFFVDSEPFAPFSHPTKFALVNRGDGKYRVYGADYYPVIDGISYWSGLEERLNQSNIAYPQNASVELAGRKYAGEEHAILLAGAGTHIPAGTPVPFADETCCAGIERKKFALIMTGYDDTAFRGDTADMYEFLKSSGYSDSDINYLTARQGEPNSDGITSLETLGQGLERIASSATCCDEVFIFLSGHGKAVKQWQYRNRNTGETRWASSTSELPGSKSGWAYTGVTQKQHRITVNPAFKTVDEDGVRTNHGSQAGGRIYSWELDAMLDRINSCYATVMYSSCFSGVAGPSLAGKGRTVITPTGDTYAWGYRDGGAVFTRNYIKGASDSSVKGEADANRDGKVSQKEAFDWAKKKTSDWAKSKGKKQDGTYTEPERCRCCHVVCGTDYTCKGTEGDGTDSALCRKIGDYCGGGKPADNASNGTGQGTGSGTGLQDGSGQNASEGNLSGNRTAVCGDGNITSPEECEYGFYGLNRCSSGKYCKSDCRCYPLETSLVCGDGKISYPNEDCDGGNVLTNICLSGYRCSICKCLPIVATCGDGRIDPGEECDHGNTWTAECNSSTDVCQSCRCAPAGQGQATHKECVGETCASVQGYGEDQCYSNLECAAPTHAACVNMQCIEVDGAGQDECSSNLDCEAEPNCGDGTVEGWEQCETDSDCGSGKVCTDCLCRTIPAYCGDGKVDAGEECDGQAGACDGGVCGGNCECVYPPSLNCENMCSEMGLPTLLGHGFASASECSAAGREEPTACYTTCIKTGYYRADNIAGWDSCCCKKKEMLPCTDCPGQNPQCPECSSEYD